MKEELIKFISEKEPQIPKERVLEIYEDMEPAILTGIQKAFRAWNEGIEKRTQDERFAKGAWVDYVNNSTSECLDHMVNHLINIVNNDKNEEHFAHLISRCFILSIVGTYPEYKGLPRKVIIDGVEDGNENLNEIEGDTPGEYSYDGE